MSGLAVRRVSGTDLLGLRAAVGRVYADAFGGPPWHEGEAGADAFLARLANRSTSSLTRLTR